LGYKEQKEARPSPGGIKVLWGLRATIGNCSTRWYVKQQFIQGFLNIYSSEIICFGKSGEFVKRHIFIPSMAPESESPEVEFGICLFNKPSRGF
jgi:hypothetical protein